MTAFNLASWNGQHETVRTLHKAGVDKEAKSKVRNLMMMMMMMTWNMYDDDSYDNDDDDDDDVFESFVMYQL